MKTTAESRVATESALADLVLPLPPSVNGYWRRVGNRTILSERARQYRTDLLAKVIRQGSPTLGMARLSINVTLHPRSKAKVDLDNYFKGLLDGLVHAGVFVDDSQVDDLRITRGSIIKGGRVTVTITKLEAVDAD